MRPANPSTGGPRAPDPHRRPAPSPARRLPRPPPGRPRRRGDGLRHRLQLGPLLSRCTATATAPTSSAGPSSRPGPRRRPRSRSGRSSAAPRTGTRTCSPTSPGPSIGSAAAARSSASAPAGRSGTTASTATSSGRVRPGSTHLGESIDVIRDRARRPQPAAGPPDAAAHRRDRRCAGRSGWSPSHADGWHAMFPDRPDELRAGGRRPARLVRRGRARPGRIEWGVGVEPDDIQRFLDEDAATYLEMGFTQFTLGFDGPAWDVLGRGALPRVARRLQPECALAVRPTATPPSVPCRREPPPPLAGPWGRYRGQVSRITASAVRPWSACVIRRAIRRSVEDQAARAGPRLRGGRRDPARCRWEDVQPKSTIPIQLVRATEDHRHDRGPCRIAKYARPDPSGRAVPGGVAGPVSGNRHRIAPASRVVVAAVRYDSMASRSPPGQIRDHAADPSDQPAPPGRAEDRRTVAEEDQSRFDGQAVGDDERVHPGPVGESGGDPATGHRAVGSARQIRPTGDLSPKPEESAADRVRDRDRDPIRSRRARRRGSDQTRRSLTTVHRDSLRPALSCG